MNSKSHPVEHPSEERVLLTMSVFEEVAFAGRKGLFPRVRVEGEVLVSVRARVVFDDRRKLEREESTDASENDRFEPSRS